MTRAVKSYQTYLLDLDGVVYRGEALLPGARAFVAWLDATGRVYRYLSNNSMASPAQVAQKLRRLDMPARDEQVLTASSAAVALIAARWPGGRVWVVALPPIRHMAARAGLTVLNLAHGDAPDDPAAPAECADAVLVGLDRSLTYAGLRQGARAILAGAAFIAVNRDPQLPVEDGFDPGCGAIVAALEAATRHTAEAVGKPSPLLVRQALADLDADPAMALMVGDAIEMDVAAGQAAGIDTALLLSGITSAERAAHAEPPPTLIAADLAALLMLARGE